MLPGSLRKKLTSNNELWTQWSVDSGSQFSTPMILRYSI